MIEVVRARYQKLKQLLAGKSEEELLWQGRVVVGHFEAVVCAVLLMADAATDGDDIALAVAERWVRTKVREGGSDERVDWKREVAMDRRIFLGDHQETLKVLPKL